MNFDLQLFLSIFTVIFLAELPDKTAFATLLMATRGKPIAIFIGVAIAFLVQSLIAVLFGKLFGLLPEHWVHLGTGILFVGFALYSWRFHDQEEEETEATTPSTARLHFLRTIWQSFLVIFIAEWGDLTQLATASLAAKYKESLCTVFLASVAALWAVTAIATTVGAKIKHVVHTTVLKKISILIFSLVGIYFIVTAL